MCCAAQEASMPHCEYINRKKMQFSHLFSSVILYPNGTKFAAEVPARQGSLHTKFEENQSRQFGDTSYQTFVLISSFFPSFCTLCKIHHKIQMCALIRLKFGTLKGLINADLSTNFGRNRMNIHGVMTGCSHKIFNYSC